MPVNVGQVAYRDLVEVTHGRDVADVPCTFCGPDRREPKNRSRPVLRLWRQPGFVSFHCARCGDSGFVREDKRKPVDCLARARIRAKIEERERVETAGKHRKALALWRNRQPIAGTIAETYLRQARGIRCPLPSTLGLLPARDEYPPAMIAAFGMATEPEPGLVAIHDMALRGVHLTRLLPDGSGKAGEDKAKIMVGLSKGTPIVLAPMNDLLGLAFCEGIEDALSIHQATGLGAWAAGSASRMPALADRVPDWIDCVTVLADADADGRKAAAELAEALRRRRIHADIVEAG